MKQFFILIKQISYLIVFIIMVKLDELWEKIFPRKAEKRSNKLWEEISANKN